MEHHSNILPWQMLCKEKGAKLVFLEPNKTTFEFSDEELNKITEKTKIVAIGHVSNVIGITNPVKKLAEKGMTVVLVCHDLEFCACTADFTAMLFEGRLAGMDRTEAFFEKNLFYTTAAGRIFRGFEADFPGAAGVIEGEER